LFGSATSCTPSPRLRPRRFTALLTVAFCLLGGMACTPAHSRPEGFTVRDDLGRTVTVPETADRVISLQPEASRILVALGCARSLVGIDYFLKKYDNIFRDIMPGAEDLPVVAYEDASVDMESVIQLNPDLIFASPYDAHIPDSLQAKTGKPVVAVSSLGSIDNLLREIRLIGRVMGRSERAEELVGFFKTQTDRVSRVVRAVPAQDRPRVYLAFWSSLGRTPVVYDPVTLAGGVNVAGPLAAHHTVSDRTVVSLEQIVKWNPDIILVHGNYPPDQRRLTVEDVRRDARLRSVKAVRDGRVWYTFGFWSWWDPAEFLVETLYLAKVFYPARFRDVDLVREGNGIYKEFYGLGDGYSLLCRAIGCDEWLKD
jgi:iron complex transport system substrate-binding protein